MSVLELKGVTKGYGEGLSREDVLKDINLTIEEGEELTEKARAAAQRLGLAFERRFTGYGDLATALARL